MTTQDRVTMREAASILGVSHGKIWMLVKEGTLPAEPNPLDRREKLIRLADLEKIKGTARRPYPRSIGMISDPAFQSEDAETYMNTHRQAPAC